MTNNFFDNYDSETSGSSKIKLLKISNELEEKNSYTKYKDDTIGTVSHNTEMFPHITSTPKSRYDNVVGQIKLK